MLRLTASDSALSRSDDVGVVVNQPPAVEAGADQTIHMPGPASLRGTVADDALPPGKVIVVAWSKVSGPGAVTFAKPNVAATSADFSEVGTYVLRLSASDSLLEDSDEVTVTVGPPLPPPPAVAITSPRDGAEITSRTDIVGSVSRGDWRLEYSLGPDVVSPESSVWTPLASGSAPVAAGVLGVFDPTLLLNGTYAIRLTAVDAGGRTASATRTVIVAGQQKVGNFSLSFEDLNVPVAGLPIRLIRTYDSRDKRMGDFGVGWTLGIKNIRLEKSAELGRYWQGIISAGTLPSYCLQPARPNVVTITFADNRVYKFQATTVKQCQGIAPIEFARFGFTPMPGTRGTLAPEAPLDVIVAGDYPGPVELLNAADPQLRTFDPTLFRFTDENGTVYIIDQKLGVRSIADTNGNRLTINRDGIIHSGGKSVSFTRDSLGRITRITDPAGNVMSYAYDANGDLTGFEDREKNRSEFTYDARHGLLSYKDPRGIQPVRYDYDDAGRLVRVTDAFGKAINVSHDLAARREVTIDRLGHATVHEYNARGLVVRETDPNGQVTTRTFDDRDRLLSLTNADGKTTRYTYDADGRKLAETDPLGNTTRFTYNSRNQALTVTDALGRVTTNAYDAKGNLLSTRTPLGTETRYTYNAVGLQTSETDALGNTTRSEYVGGDLTKQTDALGNVRSLTYDANGNPKTLTVTRTDAAGRAETLTTSYEYDRLDRLVKTANPDGTTTRSEYNSVGQQTADIDEQGRRTTYEYDAMGHAVRTIYPDGATEEMAYDAEGRRTRAVDASGSATTYAYDAAGRVVKTTYPDGTSLSPTYDVLGRPVALTDARGHTARSEYDPNCGCRNRRTKIIDPLGRAISFAYDSVGNQVSMTDAKGNVTRFEYDANNRRTRTIFPDGSESRASYDTLGRTVSKMDQAGNVTRFEYDKLSRLVRVLDALGQATAYAYDEQGRLIAQTDAANRTTRFEYDRMGRRTRRTLPLGTSETYSYDAAGQLASSTDFRGKTTAYAYDVMGRLLSKTPDPSLGQPAVTFTYTAAGQRRTMTDATGVTTYTYDARGRLLSKATPQGTLDYAYDTAGNLLTARSSNPGGLSVAYSYDALNRLSSLTDERLASGGTTSYAYDHNGNLESVAYPNGVKSTYLYNSLNRLTNLTATSASSTVAGYAYTLGPAGNRRSVAEHGGRAVQYTYDALYRLTGETANGGASADGPIGYTYDAVGNRLSRASDVPGLPDQTFTYDANDRLTSDVSDANGNTTQAQGTTYAYDSENRLTEVNGGEVRYLYDGDGNRVAKTAGGITTRYLVDTNNLTGHAQVVEELVGGTVTRQYTYGHALVSQRQLIAGRWQVSFYGYDGSGSVRYLTDDGGAVTDTYTYDAFGNLLARTGTTPNERLYAGEQFDANVGFYYLRARYMNPASGRFLTSDSAEGSRFEPQSLHKYVYAQNDPTDRVDPSGQMSFLSISLTLVTLTTLMLSGYAGVMVAHHAFSRLPPNPFMRMPDAAVLGVSASVSFTKLLLNRFGLVNPVAISLALALVLVEGVGGIDFIIPSAAPSLWASTYVGANIGLDLTPFEKAGGITPSGYVGFVWNLPSPGSYADGPFYCAGGAPVKIGPISVRLPFTRGLRTCSSIKDDGSLGAYSLTLDHRELKKTGASRSAKKLWRGSSYQRHFTPTQILGGEVPAVEPSFEGLGSLWDSLTSGH